MPAARENDGCSLAMNIHKQRQASDDRSSCLKHPRPAGAESSLTERTTSPFQTEPRHYHGTIQSRARVVYCLRLAEARYAVGLELHSAVGTWVDTSQPARVEV